MSAVLKTCSTQSSSMKSISSLLQNFDCFPAGKGYPVGNLGNLLVPAPPSPMRIEKLTLFYVLTLDSSKYLFVRLFMRKHTKWFRLDKLKHYQEETGDILEACHGLCKPVNELLASMPPESASDPCRALPTLASEPAKSDDDLITELVEFLNDNSSNIISPMSIDCSHPTLSNSAPSMSAGSPASTRPVNLTSDPTDFIPIDPALLNSTASANITTSDASITAQSLNPDPALLEEWCLRAGQLSHSLDEALDAYGIKDWSVPDSPPYDINDSQVCPDVPPIPPPVKMPTVPSFVSAPQHIPIQPTINTTQRPQTPDASIGSPPALDHADLEPARFASMTTDDCALLRNDELFDCMNIDEIKALAKKLGANPQTTRDLIILGIKAATRNQSTLCGSAPAKGKQKRQLSLKFTQKGLKESQILSLNLKILKIIGPCIKLTPTVCSLFKRLHLIFYRSTTFSDKTMTASMLARMRIRNYPAYQVIRTYSIFESRERLIEYESALELEKQFDDLLVDGRKPWNEDQQAKVQRLEAKKARLERALDVFECAWQRWQQAVMEEDARIEESRVTGGLVETHDEELTYYKRRFHPGWPLTRIMQKGLPILARFKEHDRETRVLEALLHQKHFRRGKRGQWYDRLALVLMTHLAATEATCEGRRHHQSSALYTCKEALRDPDTHQIYRFSLSKRLVKLRSLLEPSSSMDDELGDRAMHLIENMEPTSRTTIYRSRLSDDDEAGQKTIWLSPLDQSRLTVEEVALEHYVSRGWRGFHSESGILKMIFSLVFWDIIFAPVPGAFESAYQSAPLDVATDAFAIMRRPLIEEQMKRIEALGIQEIVDRLSESYLRESSKKTCCIGISQQSWSRYRLEDLQEIVQCFTPDSFKLIFWVFFEDWSVWSAGAPDLCLWKFEERQCKFVEVKGPGDKLSEQQKNWFNLLSKADGIGVEVCSVKEE